MSITGEPGRSDRVVSVSLIIAQAVFALMLATAPLLGLGDSDSVAAMVTAVVVPIVMALIVAGSIALTVRNGRLDLGSSRACLFGLLGVIVAGAVGFTVPVL